MAVVVAQLVELSFSIPEVRGLNTVIGKHFNRTCTVNCIEKSKINKKRPGMADKKSRDIGEGGERKWQ